MVLSTVGPTCGKCGLKNKALMKKHIDRAKVELGKGGGPQLELVAVGYGLMGLGVGLSGNYTLW